jgi:hypothetical protein
MNSFQNAESPGHNLSKKIQSFLHLKSILILLLLHFAFNGISRPNHTEFTGKDPAKTIESFFLAMYKCDTSLLKSCLSENCLFQTLGKNGLKTEKIKEFLISISQSKPGELDEKYKIDSIQIEPELASVWVPYTFFHKGVFSHCGTNSFQLVLEAGKWKIAHIIDTRRKSPCP